MWLLAAAVLALLCFLAAGGPEGNDECAARGGHYEIIYADGVPIVYCTEPPERQPHDR